MSGDRGRSRLPRRLLERRDIGVCAGAHGVRGEAAGGEEREHHGEHPAARAAREAGARFSRRGLPANQKRDPGQRDR
jgi:hypothetical protein